MLNNAWANHISCLALDEDSWSSSLGAVAFDGNFGAGCNGQDSGASSLAARCAADCEALISTISELLM
jgi:hypothetical protein